MFGFNLKLAIRTLLYNSRYTLINLLGLAIGMTAFMLLALFIHFHLQADKDIPRVENLYRIDQELYTGGQRETLSCTPFPLRSLLQTNYPEIQKASRVQYCGEFLSTDREHTYMERNGLYVESDFLDMFDVRLIRGDRKTALEEKNNILLDEEIARKYFGEHNPIGQDIKLMSGTPCKVSGVYRALPQNRTMRPDYLVSYTTLHNTLQPDIESNWDWCMSSTYVQLDESAAPEEFEEKISTFMNAHHPDPAERTLSLWPYVKVHLQFNRNNDNRGMFYLLGSISLFILMLASINFTNLAIAHSTTRRREIGIRKITGAFRHHIIRQFLGESLLIAFAAMILALALAELLLPWMSRIMTDNLKLLTPENTGFLLFIVAITILIGLISGSYPAFFLSSLNPERAVRGTSMLSAGNPWLRRVLVSFQFLISIALIVCTIIVYQQLDHMRNIELGFDKENILIGYLQLTGSDNENRYQSLKNDLLEDPEILHVTWAHNAPFFTAEWWRVSAEGHEPDNLFRVQHNHIEYDFLKTFEMKLVEGRNLSPESPADTVGVCLISEETVRMLGWEGDALGKTISNDGLKYTVIGIMADFHMFSVARPIDPQFFSYTTRELSWPNSHIIKVARGNDIAEASKKVTGKFRDYFPDDNIEFTILDENMDQRNFGFVMLIGQLFGIFAFLAIFIAAIGLYGLVAYVTQSKTKEIGIRKANGAFTYELFFLISREFLWLLITANLLAIPLALLAGHFILNQFASSVSIGIDVFLAAASLSLIVTFLTIGIQIYRASNANPIDSLRFE